eukprot:2562194-Amphidinium_carterae.1
MARDDGSCQPTFAGPGLPELVVEWNRPKAECFYDEYTGIELPRGSHTSSSRRDGIHAALG